MNISKNDLPYKTWNTITKSYHRIFGPNNSQCSSSRSGNLGEEDPNESSIQQQPDDSLDTLEDDGLWTLVTGNPGPVTDGLLKFHTKQNTGAKIVHPLNTDWFCKIPRDRSDDGYNWNLPSSLVELK